MVATYNFGSVYFISLPLEHNLILKILFILTYQYQIRKIFKYMYHYQECQTYWIQIRPKFLNSPDLGPNYLQRISADDKSHHYQGKS